MVGSWRILDQSSSRAMVACSPLDTTLFETADPDSALLGASWLCDLRNLRRTAYADLGSPPTESERLDAWQDPDGREHQQYGHLVRAQAPEAPADVASDSDSDWDALLDAHGLTPPPSVAAAAVAQPADAAGASRRARDKRRRRLRKAAKRSMWREI